MVKDTELEEEFFQIEECEGSDVFKNLVEKSDISGTRRKNFDISTNVCEFLQFLTLSHSTKFVQHPCEENVTLFCNF